MQDLAAYRQSNLLYTQEKLHKYRPGGYHPVSLGDTFKEGRYEVCHKLGFGGFSTVWLAKDNEQNKWVSIKIMTADSTKISTELVTLQQLNSLPGANKYIVQLLDNFIHEGPNGYHQCFVFELLGPSVNLVLESYRATKESPTVRTILRMSKQLLEAISFIHESGLAHGDINGNNIVFTSECLSDWTQKRLFKITGKPKASKLIRLDKKPIDKGLPAHLVKAMKWHLWIYDDEEDLKLIDFGESFLRGTEVEELAQPTDLVVPESIFTESIDYRVDLWRAGLMIYSFLFLHTPFMSPGADDLLVLEMIDLVGPLPAEWIPKWAQMKINSTLTPSTLASENPISSPDRLETKFNAQVHTPALKVLLPVIQGLLRFRPSDRISASEALALLQSEGEQGDVEDSELEEGEDNDEDNDDEDDEDEEDSEEDSGEEDEEENQIY
ncbi:kinase-like domain-containing protein [Xylogone sp. PMI_703]|nr:kinase-like domain-containing protein [Xylogone sp. PMI_703]